MGFHRTAKAFALALAANAGVPIDSSIYDIAHIIRLPNTLHPRTGVYKRRIDIEMLYLLDVESIREVARHPAGDGIPTVPGPVPQLEADWQDAEQYAALAVESRTAIRRDFGTADARAPRYFLDLLRFGVDEGERHTTLFRCSACLTEQGAPPSLVAALLTEPGRDLKQRSEGGTP